MMNRFSVLSIGGAVITAVAGVFAVANPVQAQTVVHVRTADLKSTDTANVKIEPVRWYGSGGYYHSYYRAPYRAYYGGPYRAYYGGAYSAWYGNPYYSNWNPPYYGPSYYGPSYYAPNYYSYPYYSGPRVGVYVGPRGGVVGRRGSFYW